jgi:signal-transduction protein with cAMP-binding, CBS, and nucleotidyltransferase domain
MKRHPKTSVPHKEVALRELQKLRIFEGISAEELQRLAVRMKLLRIKRGRDIIVEGPSTNEMICVLLSGVVKVSAINGELSPVLMGVVVAGEIFGLHSFLHEPVHRFPVRRLHRLRGRSDSGSDILSDYSTAGSI